MLQIEFNGLSTGYPGQFPKHSLDSILLMAGQLVLVLLLPVIREF